MAATVAFFLDFLGTPEHARGWRLAPRNESEWDVLWFHQTELAIFCNLLAFAWCGLCGARLQTILAAVMLIVAAKQLLILVRKHWRTEKTLAAVGAVWLAACSLASLCALLLVLTFRF